MGHLWVVNEKVLEDLCSKKLTEPKDVWKNLPFSAEDLKASVTVWKEICLAADLADACDVLSGNYYPLLSQIIPAAIVCRKTLQYLMRAGVFKTPEGKLFAQELDKQLSNYFGRDL
jgi:hypothetical protein